MRSIKSWSDIDPKDRAACKGFVAPVHSDVANCTDKVVTRQVGTAKPGFPNNGTITISNADGAPTVVNSEVTALDKQVLAADLFDVPAEYRQVNLELNSSPPQPHRQLR